MRKSLARKVLAFSFCAAFIATSLVVLALFILLVVVLFRDLGQVNRETLAKIRSGDQLYSLDGRFYVRRGVESVHLVDDEIRELL